MNTYTPYCLKSEDVVPCYSFSYHVPLWCFHILQNISNSNTSQHHRDSVTQAGWVVIPISYPPSDKKAETQRLVTQASPKGGKPYWKNNTSIHTETRKFKSFSILFSLKVLEKVRGDGNKAQKERWTLNGSRGIASISTGWKAGYMGTDAVVWKNWLDEKDLVFFPTVSLK